MAEPEEHVHDVVIVGAGISGAIIAKELSGQGLDVLVLEAGTDEARTWRGYQGQLERFYDTFVKVPESPYGWNPNAGAPDPPGAGTPGASYFHSLGPVNFRSTYARTVGGTTLHWLGTCLRMLPEDFDMRTRFGRGRDWPLRYDDLREDYERAEREIGVSADVADQAYLGIEFPPGYDFPMKRIPPSWFDQRLAAAVDGLVVDFGGERRTLHVRSTPAGRNSEPRGDYEPAGAVDRGEGWAAVELGQDLAGDIGERCQGNTACVPICPVQAKYNALKTLTKATDAGGVRVLTQAVASRVVTDGRRVTGVEYLRYASPDSPRHTVEVARGRTYVLACHAVENAKLLLNSGLPSTSGQVGRNLHDHPTVIAWGLAPEPVYGYRGPLSTSGVEDLRGGGFRREHAAFRLEIGNDGWLWPVGGPTTTAYDAIVNRNLVGRALRERMRDTVTRQFRFGLLVEQLPDPGNRVTVDARDVDALGLPVPTIEYDLDDYTLAGMGAAKGVSDAIFRAFGAEDATDTVNNFGADATWRGETFVWDGAGHYAGTHLMGDDATSSVVDANQRSWDHDNLYVVGAGSMPNMGTSNPTLTVAALAFRSARAVREGLDGRA